MSPLEERVLFLTVGLVTGALGTVYYYINVFGIFNVSHSLPYRLSDQTASFNFTTPAYIRTSSNAIENASMVHNGQNSSSDNMRVLCWILTSPMSLHTKAVRVKETWGRRCDSLIFMSDVEDPTFPTVGLNTEVTRESLTKKSMRAFDYLFKHHLDDADWFLKADDDTYIIMENLKHMLRASSPADPVYFGHHMRALPFGTYSTVDAASVQQGFASGGAGYVLSKEAVRRFGGRGAVRREAGVCDENHGGADEDVQMARCLEQLDVRIEDSRDSSGRSRFHALNLENHLSGDYPGWYRHFDVYGGKQGIESLSDLPISFHYSSPLQMYMFEYLLYGVNVYGASCEPQQGTRN